MRVRALMALAAVGLAGGCRENARSSSTQGARDGITVFAAASTTEVIYEAARRFERAAGRRVDLSFDSSSNLARQIKAGAPADVFVSADEAWMDDLVAAGAVQRETRVGLLGNRLVLIAPANAELSVRMSKDFDFAASLPQVRRLAVGDPAHVPAGRYAKQALESLGWWKSVEALLMPAQDVRAALRLVELGEADAGIVYATDVRRSPKVKLVAEFPAKSHTPIRYPAALCRDAGAGGRAFLEFLQSPEMTAVYVEAGFEVLRPADVRSEPR